VLGRGIEFFRSSQVPHEIHKGNKVLIPDRALGFYGFSCETLGAISLNFNP
jgi:hypothetical protein